MENIIVENRTKTGGVPTWRKLAEYIIRRINKVMSALVKDRADYEKVNRMIEENKLKYELFRMRL